MAPPFSRRAFLALAAAGAGHRLLRAAPSRSAKAYVPSFLHPNDRWVLLRSDDAFWYEIFDLETGQRIQRLQDSGQETYYSQPEPFFEPSGRFLVIFNREYDQPTIHYWDLEGKGAPGQLDPALFPDNQPSRPTFPGAGGICRFPAFDFDLRTGKVLRNGKKPAAAGRPEPEPEFDVPLASKGGRVWKVGLAAIRTGGDRGSYRRISTGSARIPGLTVAGTPQFWRPSESSGGPVRIAARQTVDSVVAWSGYSIVREINGATGDVVRCVSGTMPQTGLLAFGANRHKLFAARPLDVAVLWNRLGQPTPYTEGGNEAAMRPPIQELNFRPAKPDSPAVPPGTRALAYGQGRLLLGTDDGKLRLCALRDRSGGPFTVLGDHDGAVRALALAPDRPHLLSGARDGSLRLWDLAEGKALAKLPAHEARVNGAAFVAGGLGATCGPDGIRVWDLPAGTLKRHVATGGAWVSDVALDPAGRWVAGALLDGSVRLWDLPSGTLRWSVAPGHGWCACLAFDPVGGLLAAGFESSTLVLFDPEKGKVHRSVQVSVETEWQKGQGPIHAVAFAPDGKALAAGCGDAVRVFDRNLNTGKDPGWCLPLNWSDSYT